MKEIPSALPGSTIVADEDEEREVDGSVFMQIGQVMKVMKANAVHAAYPAYSYSMQVLYASYSIYAVSCENDKRSMMWIRYRTARPLAQALGL